MSRDIETVHPDDSLATAAEKMRQRGCRHLAVVDPQGALLGVLSDRELREHYGYLERTKVSGPMVEDVVTIAPEASIEAAGRLLIDHRISCLPVLDAQGDLAGMITTTDLLRALLQLVGTGGGSS